MLLYLIYKEERLQIKVTKRCTQIIYIKKLVSIMFKKNTKLSSQITIVNSLVISTLHTYSNPNKKIFRGILI
jgi:hypothetical protein